MRVDGRVVSRAVLVVMGYTGAGPPRGPGLAAGRREGEASWGELFRDLKDRGLSGVKLLVSDAHRGIVAAARRHLQGVPWQRCSVHFKRELLREVSYKQAPALVKEVRAAFGGADAAECLRRGGELASQWQSRNAAVANMLRDGLGDCLTVLAFPADYRRRLSSTNALENLMRRLKKRTRVACVFPNRARCDRLIGSQLLEVHEQWLSEPTATSNMEAVG